MRRLITGSKLDECNRKIDGGKKFRREGGRRTGEDRAVSLIYDILSLIYGNISAALQTKLILEARGQTADARSIDYFRSVPRTSLADIR